jgi:hypothetical protein
LGEFVIAEYGIEKVVAEGTMAAIVTKVIVGTGFTVTVRAVLFMVVQFPLEI